VGKNPAAECGLQLHVMDLVLVEKASITAFGWKVEGLFCVSPSLQPPFSWV
jgi:hypothetical protein